MNVLIVDDDRFVVAALKRESIGLTWTLKMSTPPTVWKMPGIPSLQSI